MKVLFLTRFGQQGASSRLRTFQFIPALITSDIDCVVSPLFDDAMLLKKYQYGSYSFVDLVRIYWQRIYTLIGENNFDLVWIEKEALPWLPAWFEKWLLRKVPYALDFDDAIFHNYDLHKSPFIRYMFGRRIDSLMKAAQLVIAGNQYLANKAIAAGFKQVEIIPTVIDLLRYTPKLSYLITTAPIIVWIGSPSTVKYLLELSEAFSVLAKRLSFTLRVIGGGLVTMPGVTIESLPWTLDTEAALIAECDIGIMPLRNTPWEQGKCAYKLIQYMACGLPTLASPIGANLDVVIDDGTGYFAATDTEWIDNLELLLCDTALRQRLGKEGRTKVEEKYCLQKIAPQLVNLLTTKIN
jgi:glycosyltransferase involved in cell wall biosynthesis